MKQQKLNRRKFLKTTGIYSGMMVFANACIPWFGKSISGKNSKAPASLSNLRCEYLSDPLSIDTKVPRLSWEMLADDPAGKRWTGSLKRHNKQRKEVNMRIHTRVNG